MKLKKSLSDLFKKYPRLALLGFIPPIWIVGAGWLWGWAFVQLAKKPDFFDLFGIALALVIAPKWPLDWYQQLKEPEELSQLPA